LTNDDSSGLKYTWAIRVVKMELTTTSPPTKEGSARDDKNSPLLSKKEN
jgi:hypothetical protein